MHIVVINASPRMEKKSNTETIIRAFLKDYEQGENTAELYHLSDRRQWADAERAFEENEHILFALPLYVENIPGVMLEFLEGLQPKKSWHKAFLSAAERISGGVPETVRRALSGEAAWLFEL